MRQANVKSLITDYNKYKVALNTFKLEYSELPGDLSNASAYGIGTNGNGDRRIHSQFNESHYAWQHLGNAGLVSGSYTGADAGTPDYQAGINIPGTSFDGVVVYISYIGASNGNCLGVHNRALFGVQDNFNLISFAKMTNCPSAGFLKVAEAHGIDSKIDDGEADKGFVFSANTHNNNSNGDRCVDNRVQGSGGASYDFDESGENCRLIIKF